MKLIKLEKSVENNRELTADVFPPGKRVRHIDGREGVIQKIIAEGVVVFTPLAGKPSYCTVQTTSLHRPVPEMPL